jgi:hypothetical protein
MTEELRLFNIDEPELKKLSNTNGTQASKAAAKKVAPKLRGIKKDIIELLEQTPEGLTIFEIAEVLNLKLQTVSGRPSELLSQQDPQIFIYGTRALPDHDKATIYKHVKFKKKEINIY